jgi:hypothetical protein
LESSWDRRPSWWASRQRQEYPAFCRTFHKANWTALRM